MGVHIPRVEVAFGYYHLSARGNNRRFIFDDDHDREVFLAILDGVARRYGWRFYAWCLMGNHYHLILQIGDGGLSQGMCELNTAHATNYNVRHGRVNHLFGKRFWSEQITTDAYLLASCRYVLQNPVRAGLAATCADWKWSSYRSTVGTAPPEPYLAVRDLLAILAPNAKDPAARMRDFCARVAPQRRATSACTPGRTRPPAASDDRPSR
jgi:REP element-mobilizing transposase RayT